ncbi:MAG: DUF5107 domain-containing protein, partial [Planctomycetota bacterium]
DFSGGYDHGKQAGVVHVGNHNIVCGAKLWEWSPGPRGRMWDKILTDTDGPYAELMVGAFSDNQPDYSWIKPYETKTFKQYWYPVREIGGFKNANLSAAVNLKLDSDTASLGFCVTSQHSDAKVRLAAGDKVILERTIDIGPDKPFTTDVKVPAGAKETDLRASLISAANEMLISYRPVDREYDPDLPEVVKAPPDPQDIEKIEELYLTGLRLEQIHNPRLDPDDYFNEVLRRDPGDSRTNTILGIKYNKRAMYEQAEQLLRKAIERISAEYTRPGNTEAYYHLGLALRAQRKFDEASDVFYRATWDYAFHSPAYYQLAELSCRKGDFTSALEQIDHSLSTNALNTKALNVKAAILRKLGKFDEAKQIASDILAVDPLDFMAMNELSLVQGALGRQRRAKRVPADLERKMAGQVESYLELAVDYANAGLWDEAIEVLSRPADNKVEFAGTYPMAHYYLGYFCRQNGDSAGASRYFSQAPKMPMDYCFPFRLESIEVLRSAIENNRDDARAYYYLGNLLYDLQPQEAIGLWEKSRGKDDSLAIVHRNLGWAYYRTENDIPKAVASYEKAVACNRRDARLYYELDRLYEAGNVSLDRRLALFEGNHEIAVQRNDSFLREIMVLVSTGKYDLAIDHLTNNHFHVREGGGRIHDVFVDAHLLRGLRRAGNGRLQDALADFLKASEYPENLSVGRPSNDRRAAQVACHIATAYAALGDDTKAQVFYKKAAEQERTRSWPEARFYQGMSLVRLGRTEPGGKIFDELIESSKQRLSEQQEVDVFAKFGEGETPQARKASAHYALGLGYLGRGRNELARTEFEKAIELNVSHVWARAQLEELSR